MEIIPVIEIRQGKSPRLTNVQYDRPSHKTDDTLSIAHRWKNEGATRIHIHDLCGARTGMPHNRDQVRDIVRRVGLPVQYSGGVRTIEVMQRVLSWGVDRVVADIESTNEVMMKDALAKFGDHAILELCATDETVPMPGGGHGACHSVHDFVQAMNNRHGWPRFICRQVHGDGSLAIPDHEALARLKRSAGRTHVQLYARIRTWDEFRALQQTGVEALLIGEALYDGMLALPELRRESLKPVPPGAPPTPLARPSVTQSQFGYRDPAAPAPPGQRPPVTPSGQRAPVLGAAPGPGARPPVPPLAPAAKPAPPPPSRGFKLPWQK